MARAAPALRRLLLPMLAGSLAALVLSVQGLYRLFTGEFMRSSEEVTALVLVTVPLAFLVGILRAHFARAGMADLIVALQRTRDPEQVRALLARALGDPSLELLYWLPGFECYVDARGKPVAMPGEGPGRAATPVEHDGERVAVLVHDAALNHEPELLEVVCAAADVALERERLHAELESRVAGARRIARPAGRGRRRRAAADRARPPRRRAAAARVAGDRAPPHGGPHPGRSRRRPSGW